MSTKSKGLSSVVGAVLLITISIGAAGSAWSFINSVQGGVQDNVDDRIEERGDELETELSSDIAYNSSDGFTLITIRNTGSTTIRLGEGGNGENLNVFVRGRPQNDWTFLNEEKNSLQREETTTLNTTVTFPEEGEDYSIEVIGPSDTSTTYICYNSGTASC